MPTKITAVFENPQDPEAFEAGHGDQVALAKKIPRSEEHTSELQSQ